MSKAYTSNLTRDQFDLIAPLLPAAKPGGHPRSVCLWLILNAILYVVVQGCKWRDLPTDFPAWSTAYTYFRNWRKDGTWQLIHDCIRGWTRAEAGRAESLSEAIIDSQTVPTPAMANQAVGYDGAKKIKGHKRHTVVDTLGLVMMVVVTAASVPERQVGQQTLSKLKALGDQVSRLYLVWADGGYSGQPFMKWVISLGWLLQVVLRPQQRQGLVLLKTRWTVERTFGWWQWYRRLSVDYECLPESAKAMIHIAMIRLMLRRLA